jgi:hypothetical protein
MNCQQHISLIVSVVLIHPAAQASASSAALHRPEPVLAFPRLPGVAPNASPIGRASPPVVAMLSHAMQDSSDGSQIRALSGQTIALLPDGKILMAAPPS